MSHSSIKSMTSGSPWKLILGFAAPMLLGMILQQIYSMVDSMIVGQYLGVDAFAGVGSTGSINFMIIGFCMGVCNGIAIPVAQRFGAQDRHGLRCYVANGVWLAVILAVVFTVVVCVLCRQILIWMQTPGNILDYADRYIFIIFLGIPATILYDLLSALIRALGDSRTPVVFLALAALLNVVLDLLFIITFGMGVEGAAIATVISQLCSGLACLVYIAKKFPLLVPRKQDWRFRPRYFKNLCGMGIPMGLQYSITAIGSVILQTAVNGLGSAAVAAVSAGNRVSNFACCPFDALGSTMATYVGQNLGAGKIRRVKTGLFSGCAIGFAYSIVAAVVLGIFGSNTAMIFLDAGETAIATQAGEFLRWASAFYVLLTLVNCVRFTIQGLGYGKLALFSGLCEMVARTGVALILIPIFGFTGACMAHPAAWILADAFLVPAFFVIYGRLKKRYGEETGQPLKNPAEEK